MAKIEKLTEAQERRLVEFRAEWLQVGNPHGAHVIEPGKYEIPIKREFNPFTEQARMVAD